MMRRTGQGRKGGKEGEGEEQDRRGGRCWEEGVYAAVYISNGFNEWVHGWEVCRREKKDGRKFMNLSILPHPRSLILIFILMVDR